MDFTSWDAGLHSRDPNALQHYGVQGMKWGVRRYQNPDGTLTPAGQKHYGEGRYMSARKLQFHYNRADQVRSNAIAERNIRAQKAFKYGVKATQRGDKLFAKGKDPTKDRRTMRLMNKAKKYLNKTQDFANQAKEAEALQAKGVRKAKEMGYTMAGKATPRVGYTRGMYAAQVIGGWPAAIGYGVAKRKALSTGGTYVKVRSDGDRSIKIDRRPDGSPLSQKQVDYAKAQISESRTKVKHKRRG